MEPWPLTPEELRMAQESLAAESPPPWRPAGRGWARSVAAWLVDGRPVASAVVDGPAGAAYEPGLLALLGHELVHLGVDGHAQGIGHQGDALLESDMARRGTGNREIRGSRRSKFLTNHRVRL